VSVNILYDITRLLSRSLAPSPRGIDRVDIRYAQHCLSHFDSLFIYQKSGVFFVLETLKAKQLIQTLAEKWQSSALSADYQAFHQALFSETLGQDGAPWRKKRPVNSHAYVDGKLQQQLQASTQGWVYLNVSHQGVSHYSAYVQLRALGVKRIVFYLHDTIPADFPEFVNFECHQRQLIQLAVMASCADTVLVNSNYTEQCFSRFSERYGFDLPDIQQIHIGLDVQFRMDDQKQGVSLGSLPVHQKPYFIVVGAIEKRKNVDFLLPIWERLAEVLPAEAMPQLLLVGQQTPHGMALQKSVSEKHSIRKHVKHLTTICDDELLILMKNAQALLFPSLVEGWGMPVVEALNLQVPVIASNIPAFKESSQGHAILLDIDKPEVWFDEIQRMLNDEIYRQQWVDKASVFKAPSWEAHFAAVDRCLLDGADLRLPLSVQAIETNILAVESIDKQVVSKEMRAIKQSRRTKRVVKFLSKPQAFLKDSKFAVFRAIGRLFSD
jgi:glycosyltransferase involved in cell wall biosynthesis